jgi:hypothetical protein
MLIDLNLIRSTPYKSKLPGPGLFLLANILVSIKDNLGDLTIFILVVDLNFLIIGVSYFPGPGTIEGGS